MKGSWIWLCLAVGLLLGGQALCDPPKVRDNETNRDKKKMQDTYRATCIIMKGEWRSEKDRWLIVKDDTFRFMEGGKETMRAAFKLDAVHKPKHIDLTFLPDDKGKGVDVAGIYDLGGGDQIVLCVAEPGAERPTEFSSKKGDHVVFVMLFERVKENK